ncbi:MAG: UDP-N-acetylglucosamine 1-carboxyvinyltransferase [Candidatus Levybacteria bacterium RIFCSPHIGHO2_01_FULL_36_15]|nr:MAG: UDP-N-acetylglucosamine 1-carboxyvinyltransferase [Candidatus Levybacteria bacterium RIFCSPHIGHO2_01_FULL_36_15]OGH37949.1 MAG: UDP-N-acetylglucosamine 1-carboxyvinyltransferase [Candidatus Levybacteria bacterium RIFCSPLOWO2_01_FULL_36_10]
MKKYVINGGIKLQGEVNISGSKNVVLKAIVAACLTKEEIKISNVPLISDFYTMLDIFKEIGGKVGISGHKVTLRLKDIKSSKIPLEMGAKIRTSSMFLAPLLLRSKKAVIPNPGGCRIGARPIDRHIEGLEKMGAKISYVHEDGYFHAQTDGLHGATYKFKKNTHTGTETLILAGSLAHGQTILENAAQEPEIDDLIDLLNRMGAKIKRSGKRKIIIEGVKNLHGASLEVMPDRNEFITFAIASALSGGKIWIKNGDLDEISVFLDKFKTAGGKWEEKDSKVRFYLDRKVISVDVKTSSYPGFMTDWQGPWAVLMTQAEGGSSVIHETVYESRFGYVDELKKMGAKIELFNPEVKNPTDFYNFNYEQINGKCKHAAKIYGKTPLHNAVLNISDLRAGATLVIAALIAKGESVVFGIEHLERGYENFDERLKKIGANIKLVEEQA